MDQSQLADTARLRKATTALLLTAISIPGAVLVFLTGVGALIDGNVLDGLPVPLAIPTVLATVTVPFLVGAGLWGYGMARLFDAPRWPATRTAALAVTGMVLLLEAPVHLSQALPVPSWFPLGVHGAFTLVFMVEISLVAGVASTRLIRRLEVNANARHIGRKVATAGAGGFLVGSLLALAAGFEVGTPPAMNMVWGLHVANLIAASAAGWTLGWNLTTHTRTIRHVGAVSGGGSQWSADGFV
jgi:hypothetical protein